MHGASEQMDPYQCIQCLPVPPGTIKRYLMSALMLYTYTCTQNCESGQFCDIRLIIEQALYPCWNIGHQF